MIRKFAKKPVGQFSIRRRTPLKLSQRKLPTLCRSDLTAHSVKIRSITNNTQFGSVFQGFGGCYTYFYAPEAATRFAG